MPYMRPHNPPIPDVTALVESLEPDTIVRRLQQINTEQHVLNTEQRVLRGLLRVVRTDQRVRGTSLPRRQEEARA